MLKIKLSKDFISDKVTGIDIIVGDQCSVLECPRREECKYRKGAGGRFILKWFYINKYWLNLYGTNKCLLYKKKKKSFFDRFKRPDVIKGESHKII